MTSPRHASWELVAVAGRELGALVRAGVESLLPASTLPPPEPAPDAVPVVLVHGYLATSSALQPLARALLRAGAPEVAFVDYPSLTASLEDIVDEIASVAVPHARRHGSVDVVAHSLGAVATRAWIKAFGGDVWVRRFVSLGGPHAGTSLHRVVPSPVRDALDPRGEWARRLAQGPEPVPTTVVRARWDHQVFPPVRARIDGAWDVVVGGYGHNGLLFAPEAHDAVVGALYSG